VAGRVAAAYSMKDFRKPDVRSCGCLEFDTRAHTAAGVSDSRDCGSKVMGSRRPDPETSQRRVREAAIIAKAI
jgi:hypothetical protein